MTASNPGGAPGTEGRPWRLLRLALRIAVTVALLAAVAARMELADLRERASATRPGWILGAFAVVFGAIAISAVKWGAILRARNQGLPFIRLLRHYLVGLFFNNLLPTSVGGDAVRAWETTRDTGEVPEAVSSVVSERLVAGAALGFTALLGLPFVDAGPRLVLLVAAFLLVDLALVALFLVPRVAEAIVSATLPRRLGSARASAAATVAAVRSTLRSPRLFVGVFLLSVLFQVLVAAVNVCLFRAVGAPVGLASCIVYTPLIFTITMLPISLSGLGVREAAYGYFFAQTGVAQVDAIAVSLGFFLVVGAASLPGAPLFALGRDRAPSRTTEALNP